MSDNVFYSIFISMSALAYLPALWTKVIFSGDRFTSRKLCIAIVYSFTFVVAYWRYADAGHLPFMEINDDPIMRTLAIIMSLAYIFALPTPWKKDSTPL